MDLNATTVHPCDLKNWQIFSSLETKFISNVRIAVVYGNFANEALIVTKDNMVYSIGNTFEFGIGSIPSSLCPKKVEILCGEDIKTIAYGKGPHVLVLTQQGKIYSWGYNHNGELGNGSTVQSQTPLPISEVLTDEYFIDIACGGHHSLALTNKGQVYAWGNMLSKQTNQASDQYKTKPTLLMSLLHFNKIVRISCGDSFSMALTDSGQVYSWGDNTVGQLGT